MQLKITIIFSIIFLLQFPLFAQVAPDYLLQKGIKAYQNENYREAIVQFSRLLSIDSTHRDAYYLLSSAYLTNQQAQKSLEVSTEGLKRYPRERTLHWITAEAYLQKKEVKASLRHYQLIHDTYQETGNMPSNITVKALKQRLGQVHSQLGNHAVIAGEFILAIRHFAAANQVLPDQAFTYTNLALAYIKNKDWEKALQIAEAGLKRFPEQESLISAKTNALYQKKDYKALTEEYAKLHQNHPENIDIAIAYGELLMANQEYGKASELYNNLIKNHPQEKKIYESLLKVYESKLNFDGKVRVLKQMLPHFDKAEIYRRIAASLEMMNRWSEVRKYYDTLMTYVEEDLPLRKKIAHSYVEEDSLEKAQNYYQDLLKDYPEDQELLMELGQVQEENEDWEKALQTYQKLESIDPGIYVDTRLGYVYQELGQSAKALDYYAKVIENKPVVVAYLGASQLIKQSQPDSAFWLAKKAFELAFSDLKSLEKQLNQVMEGGNSIAKLAANKELMREADKKDELATQIFHHLASFEYLRAKTAILEFTQNFSESAKLHFLIGEFFYQHNQFDQALHRLEMAAKLNPNLQEVHLLIGEIQQSNRNVYSAILAYERVLTLNHQSEKAFKALIKLYQKEGKLNMLCEKWLAKYQADQKNKVLQEYLIEALHKAGKYKTAKKIIEANKES